MRILQACAELFPLLKTGGLADVAGALPPALRAAGADVRVLLPGFRPMLEGVTELTPVAELDPPAGLCPPESGARLLRGRLPACGTPAYLIDAPRFYLREGGPYADDAHRPYADNHLRFALLGWAAAALAHGLDPDCVEAMGFAWLAWRTAHGLAGNLPSVTGARGPRVLGGIYPA